MSRHSQHCRECKRTIQDVLTRLFGDVEEQYDLQLPAVIDDFKNYACYESLAKIYQILTGYRGYDSFVRSAKLPRVDYYIPSIRMVVEFDEAQHFTRPRLMSLRSYPQNLALGYDRQRWMELAQTLDRTDRNPFYRDEQRAWYDTLRDYSSLLLSNVPTKRIYAGDCNWCSLDAENKQDVLRFKELCFPEHEVTTGT